MTLPQPLGIIIGCLGIAFCIGSVYWILFVWYYSMKKLLNGEEIESDEKEN